MKKVLKLRFSPKMRDVSVRTEDQDAQPKQTYNVSNSPYQARGGVANVLIYKRLFFNLRLIPVVAQHYVDQGRHVADVHHAVFVHIGSRMTGSGGIASQH